MTNQRVVGIETEYGVALDPDTEVGTNPNLRHSPEGLSVVTAQAVRSWQASLRPDGRAIGWDWEGEDPLNDLRGTRLERASADPTMLTDDPHRFAPATPGAHNAADDTFSEQELVGQSSPMLTNVVMTNGGRFYVDHAHPEYSTPEVLTARDAVVWDVAGEHVARRAMKVAASYGSPIALYKNNTDSKGLAYGSHENYLLAREVPFALLRDYLVPFLVTRPVICGAGRVGIGKNSETCGFQMSQRADFVGDLVGLQTTFNRPIVNTRDESHAGSKWRRLHVINGDANRFPGSILAKVSSSRAWLAALEAAWKTGRTAPPVEGLFLECDPVEAGWQVSHDIDFTTTLRCADGRERSALEWQWTAANTVADFLHSQDRDVLLADALTDVLTWVDTVRILREDPVAAARRVEWVAKRTIFQALSERIPGGWSSAKLAALDIQWADLRPGLSPVDKLRAKGHVEDIAPATEIIMAATQPPAGTRAKTRGEAVAHRKDLVAASWTSLVVRAGWDRLQRIELRDPFSNEALTS
ncbi:proteasome accessory factor PafA2 family protein [uncultured Mobiluncus sp.]|uniref:proteasome accessory factor PafA2 family protein n=1 Tax=uncultured Mobiluncus sp. TaxID=293425 RepID=UPI00260D0514|nr:proteasome accessory factor PafA2 family protein [uncultured Mobiluncus sp.]